MLTDAYGPTIQDQDDFAYSANLLTKARGKITVDPTVTTEKEHIRKQLESDLAQHTIGSFTKAAIMQGTHPVNFDPDHLTHWTRADGQVAMNKAASNRLENVSRQVGGTHYTKMKIDVFTFTMANGLDPLQHSIIKYVARFRDKGGIEDLNKAMDCLHKLIAYETTKASK